MSAYLQRYPGRSHVQRPPSNLLSAQGIYQPSRLTCYACRTYLYSFLIVFVLCICICPAYLSCICPAYLETQSLLGVRPSKPQLSWSVGSVQVCCSSKCQSRPAPHWGCTLLVLLGPGGVHFSLALVVPGDLLPL